MKPTYGRPRKRRGALSNRTGRFERFQVEPDPDRPPERDDDQPAPADAAGGWESLSPVWEPPVRPTTITPEITRSIITRNDSPDIPFDRSINPYKGCEHGCIYCFARPTHAYIGMSPGLDFETRIIS